MCWPMPSATSDMPISSRKESASIFTVGWRLTKALTGSAETIMKKPAMRTASTITGRCSATPTAVMTESSEKTMSRRAIWTMTELKDAAPSTPARASSSPSSL